MILKLQRPLAGPEHDVLCYSQDRRVRFIVSIDDNLRKLFGDRYKIYVDVPTEEAVRARLVISEVKPDCSW
jgi:hypothetical protein